MGQLDEYKKTPGERWWTPLLLVVVFSALFCRIFGPGMWNLLTGRN